MRQQQAAKSPDTNVNDMTVFNWMQGEMDRDEAETRDELLKSAKIAFRSLSLEHIAKGFQKKTEVCKFILSTRPPGGNHFRF